MTADERALLLTVARLMQARIADEVALARHFKKASPRDDADFVAICDALRPFDPSSASPPTEPVNLGSWSNTESSPNNNVSATPAGKGETG